MENNIDKDEIRRAIDRLQIEHPCNIACDPISFVNMEAVNTIKGCVDQIAKRMAEDTEINIICEFAKLYLEGVRPTIMPKQEWIPCKERLPDPEDTVLFCNQYGEVCIGCKFRTDGTAFIDYLTSNMTFATAWMPLPEPYKEGGGEK